MIGGFGFLAAFACFLALLPVLAAFFTYLTLSRFGLGAFGIFHAFIRVFAAFCALFTGLIAVLAAHFSGIGVATSLLLIRGSGIRGAAFMLMVMAIMAFVFAT